MLISNVLNFFSIPGLHGSSVSFFIFLNMKFSKFPKNFPVYLLKKSVYEWNCVV